MVLFESSDKFRIELLVDLNLLEGLYYLFLVVVSSVPHRPMTAYCLFVFYFDCDIVLSIHTNFSNFDHQQNHSFEFEFGYEFNLSPELLTMKLTCTLLVILSASCQDCLYHLPPSLLICLEAFLSTSQPLEANLSFAI